MVCGEQLIMNNWLISILMNDLICSTLYLLKAPRNTDYGHAHNGVPQGEHGSKLRLPHHVSLAAGRATTSTAGTCHTSHSLASRLACYCSLVNREEHF